MMLTKKQQTFIDCYFKYGSGPKAAIEAGYAAKSAAIEANRLLKNPKIIEAVDLIRKETIREKFSKDNFIEYALNDYKSLEVTAANKPRFLELAGKGAGIIGSSDTPQTNNTQINIDVNILSLDSGQKWDSLRKLLG